MDVPDLSIAERRTAYLSYGNALDVNALAMPADALGFQEREADQDEIIKALRAGVVVIYGIGGAGKTTLAVHVANTLKDKFANGLRYLNLEGMSARPPSPAKARAETARAMAQIIQSFDEKAKVPEELDLASRRYREVLREKQVLLLLDNARDRAQVQPLIDPNNRGRATIIVTSRQRFKTNGPPIHLEELSPDDAERFLSNRLGTARPQGLKLRPLAERCGRLPLALSAAADFLIEYPNFVSAEQYMSALDSGAISMRLGDEPEKDVLAVLGLSIAQLARNNPPLSERWHALLKFAADFDVAAVVAVWNCTGDEARRDLGKLLARSMLRFDRKSERYGLHDLMREAANRRLAATAARPREPRGLEEAPASYDLQWGAEMRLAQHYCDLLQVANQLYTESGDKMLRGLAL